MRKNLVALLALLFASAAYATPYRIAIDGTLDTVYLARPDAPFPFTAGQSVTGWIEYDSEGAERGQPDLHGSLRYDIRVGDVDFLTSTLIVLKLFNEPAEDYLEFYSGSQWATGYPNSYIGDLGFGLSGPPGAVGNPFIVDDFWAITHGFFGYNAYAVDATELPFFYHVGATFKATPVPEPSPLALSLVMVMLTGVVFAIRRQQPNGQIATRLSSSAAA